MSFINLSAAGSISTLKAAHYSFPRADRLREDMVWMVTDYYAKASLRRPFEARGLLVTGPSRTGKSTEIRRQIDALNDGSTIMPDGRPARFVSVVLKGLLSWKDLGIHTLDQGLNYSATGRLTQREVWERVVIQAREQGVIGIHYDECQHIFPRVTGEARAMILDSFKSLLKQPEWPLMLILSGVDSLVQHITSEEQLAYLMRPISFPEVALHRPADLAEMISLCNAYADMVGEGLGSDDQFETALVRLRRMLLGHGSLKNAASRDGLSSSILAEDEEDDVQRQTPEHVAYSLGLQDFENAIGTMIGESAEQPDRLPSLLTIQFEIGMWMRIHRLEDIDGAFEFLGNWLRRTAQCTTQPQDKVTALSQHFVTSTVIRAAFMTSDRKSEKLVGLHDDMEKFFGGAVDRELAAVSLIDDADKGFAAALSQGLPPIDLNAALSEVLSTRTRPRIHPGKTRFRCARAWSSCWVQKGWSANASSSARPTRTT